MRHGHSLANEQGLIISRLVRACLILSRGDAGAGAVSEDGSLEVFMRRRRGPRSDGVCHPWAGNRPPRQGGSRRDLQACLKMIERPVLVELGVSDHGSVCDSLQEAAG